MGVVDDDGVGVGNVQAVFDDGGGNQHVVFIIDKIEDDFLQGFRLYLPVPDGDAGIGHFAADNCLNSGDMPDVIVDDKYLPVAAHLKVDSFADNVGVEAVHFRLYRIAVGRRRGDVAQIAGTHEGELQGAGNGGCRHRQGVHIGFELAQLFLYGDAKLLLFVYDEQPKVFELHVLAHDAMRAYQYINLSLAQLLQCLLYLCRCAGAADVIYFAGEIFQAFREGLIMLEGKYRGWHEHSRLLVVSRCFEGSADGHFRFAEAHIAAYQPVHRAVALHVLFHFGGRLCLVGSVLVNETRLQLMLQIAVRREGKALFLLAAGVEEYQIAGDVLHLRLGLFLHPFPCTAAKLAQLGRLAAFLALVFGKFVQGVDAYEDGIVVEVV
ncbi:hypothetical protein Barb6XT_00767 [Bacteroidales bacterium Barb6XT]|nr:hypothetical protein Barb6XT_00767 [Bacteroidales bacterium Barb6XT]